MFPTQSPTRTNIVEANKHLKMLYGRVQELEIETAKHKDALVEKDRDFEATIIEVNRRKDSEIADLQRTVDICRKQNQNLQKRLQERDMVIHELSKKCQLLDKITSHRNSLQKVVDLMDTFDAKGGGGVDGGRGGGGAGEKVTPPRSVPPAKNALTNNSTGTTFIAIGGSPTGSLTNHVEVVNHVTSQDGDADADDESEGGLGSPSPIGDGTSHGVLRHNSDVTPPHVLRSNNSSMTPSSRSSDLTSRTSDSTPASRGELSQSLRGVRRSDMRHFSISEDDSGNEADNRDSVFRKMRRDKELYL